jgi:hypothetical protein
MEGLVESLQRVVDQLGRLGLSSLALFMFFVAIYVATAVFVVRARSAAIRLACFAINQLLTAIVVLVALKSALPAPFPWKETLGMAVVSFGAVFALLRLRRARGAEGGESPKEISRRARKLAESSQKAAAANAAIAAAALPEITAPTASDISRRIDSHSRKRAPVMKSMPQAGFGRR